jgi:hypothetical protein
MPELEKAKAKELEEMEKQRAAMEKSRTDEVSVKLEEQKKLAEENEKSAMEAKQHADQMSQKLEENNRIMEELKQRVDELSSERNSNEVSGISTHAANAESARVQLLERNLELVLQFQNVPHMPNSNNQDTHIFENELMEPGSPGASVSDRAQKKRKISLGTQAHDSMDGKKESEEENRSDSHNVEVNESNYSNILDLENSLDEEIFTRAIEEPVSPSLPNLDDIFHMQDR